MVTKRLVEKTTPTAKAEIQFFEDFAKQPADQKGGTVYTVANFLRPYTVPDIADVFCAIEPNFSLCEVDQGRLICKLSLLQTLTVPRAGSGRTCGGPGPLQQKQAIQQGSGPARALKTTSQYHTST